MNLSTQTRIFSVSYWSPRLTFCSPHYCEGWGLMFKENYCLNQWNVKNMNIFFHAKRAYVHTANYKKIFFYDDRGFWLIDWRFSLYDHLVLLLAWCFARYVYLARRFARYAPLARRFARYAHLAWRSIRSLHSTRLIFPSILLAFRSLCSPFITVSLSNLPSCMRVPFASLASLIVSLC